MSIKKITSKNINSKQDDEIIASILKALYNCCSLEDGLNLSLHPSTHKSKDPVPVSVVDSCVEIINRENAIPFEDESTDSLQIQISEMSIEALRTLSFICYSDLGREKAIEAGVVEASIKYLKKIASMAKINIYGKINKINISPLYQRAILSNISCLASASGSDQAKLRIFPCEVFI